MKLTGVLVVACFVFMATAQARHNSNHPLTAEDWKDVMDKVVLLEGSGFMPSLLPVIMRNQDAIQLTDEQIRTFRAWRKKHYTHMVNLMNEIIEKKVQFSVESLSPGTSSAHLIEFQSQIHELQRQLLTLKLSCRELVMTSFTEQQWENFAFVVADDRKLASLMSQSSTTSLAHVH